MHKSIINLNLIKNNLKINTLNSGNIKIIAVSKTFSLPEIQPLIDHGHTHFGENKVQEAFEKWSTIKKNNKSIKLHLLGRLQSNKVKTALNLFDYIHSLDSEKLAKKIANEELNQSKKIKLFIQVNFDNEEQKSGISEYRLQDLYRYSLNLGLDVIGTMCIPPISQNPEKYFKRLKILNDSLGLKELSMGMSSDYLIAAESEATFIRVGSSIFGERIKKF